MICLEVSPKVQFNKCHLMGEGGGSSREEMRSGVTGKKREKEKERRREEEGERKQEEEVEGENLEGDG